MEIVKKNLLSIIFGVIALAAIVTAFWPLGGYYEDLQADLEKSKVRHDKAIALLKKVRQTPVVAPGQKPVTLIGYPTPRDLKSIAAEQEQLQKEGRNILAVAVLNNIKEVLSDSRSVGSPTLDTFNPDSTAVKNAVLLVPSSLPNPDANAPFAFQKALDAEMKNLREVVLKGGTPPTKEEIDKADKALRELKNADLQFTVAGQPARNQKQVDEDYEDERVKIPGRLREEAASKYLIYIEPGVLQVDPSIKLGTLSKEQIWFAQNALWIQEDVAHAIKEVNAAPRPGKLPPATNVKESLVKRLVRLDIPLGPDMYQHGTGNAGGTGGEAPPPVQSQSRGARGGPTAMGGGATESVSAADTIPGGSEPPKPNLALSATGRASNNLYDVIHFNLVVDIDSRAAQLFLNQLSRGRLIAVRKVDITRPDLADGVDKGYLYNSGKQTASIIQLNIDCEALLLRDWTIPLMPAGVAPRTSIREMLGVPAAYVSLLAPKKDDTGK